MRTIPVNMMALCDEGIVRRVQVPENLSGIELLEAIFHYGQNDVQQRDCPSLSAGDVAEINGYLVMCCRNGWRILSDEEFAEYNATSQTMRPFHPLVQDGAAARLSRSRADKN